MSLTLSPVDTLLQKQFPTLMVPIHQLLEKLTIPGHRFLMAKNGLFMEVMRSWLHAIVPLCSQSKVAFPYGIVKSTVAISSVPAYLINEFSDYAKTQLPNECAGHIIFNKTTGQWKMIPLTAVEVSRDMIDFTIEPLAIDEECILDIHSHGFHNVYFSSVDDVDDDNSVKLAGVIGFSLDENEDLHCKALFRLCLNGVFATLKCKEVSDQYEFSVIDEIHQL